MKFVRVRIQGDAKYARVDGEWLTLLDRAPWDSKCRDTVTKVPLADAELLVPSDASKVVAIGQNYAKHVQEMGKTVPPEPRIFIKPSTALNATRRPIRLPPDSQDVQHEAELALVIGRTLYRAGEDEARAAIFGATCFNDVTARDIQKREVQNTRAKSYDTFACCGPWIETESKYPDLAIRCRVNGQIKQDGRSSAMLVSPVRLVSFISNIMTLLPGDIVSTGTPEGVGTIVAGDTVEVEIEGIGTLVNPVEKAAT